MLFKFAVVVAALTTLVAGVPAPNGGVSQCNTGIAQCCNTVTDASSPQAASILDQLNIALGSVTGQVGLECGPLNVVGSGADCAQSPVCCTDNRFEGLISIGCNAIGL